MFITDVIDQGIILQTSQHGTNITSSNPISSRILNCPGGTRKSEYLAMISVKELEETSLCTSCSFHSTESQVILCPLNVPQVHQQILYPHTCPLSNSGQLSRSINKQKLIIITRNTSLIIYQNSSLSSCPIRYGMKIQSTCYPINLLKFRFS